MAPAGPVYQAGTLSGNPLAMTAGLWSLEQLSAELYTQLATLGGMLAAGLADAAREAGVPLQVNAFGSLLTPFFTSGPSATSSRALTSDTAAYGRFFRGMLARGVYPPPSQFEAWFLSSAHSERDIDRTIKAAARRCGRSRKNAQRPRCQFPSLLGWLGSWELFNDRGRRIQPHAQDRSGRQRHVLPFGGDHRAAAADRGRRAARPSRRR